MTQPNNEMKAHNIIKHYEAKMAIKKPPINPYVYVGLPVKTVPPILLGQFPKVSAESICAAVCEVWGIDEEELRGKSRARDIIYPRHMAAHMMHKHIFWQGNPMTLLATGKCLGGRHHTSILHEVRAAQDLIDTDSNFLNKYREVEARLATLASGQERL